MLCGRRPFRRCIFSIARRSWASPIGPTTNISLPRGGSKIIPYAAECSLGLSPGLTHENLKELGVTALGHRLKLLDAIAALRSDASGKATSVDTATTSNAPSAHPEDRAERRQVTTWGQTHVTYSVQPLSVYGRFGQNDDRASPRWL